ncbi:MAG: serine/threonine protein kinase [Alphaproteobacteria bacterium]|nr:serine/threonine protein kinase [Alphaproteobacteria bacterium]
MEATGPEILADGRYLLVSVLGEGGMAKVWSAYDDRLQVHRAIKVLAPAFSNRPNIRRRFLNEARTMARLHHPHIVGVHDVVEDERSPYIVMELIRGGSLSDYLEAHGAMPPRMAVNAMLDVLSALEVAHDAGVIHRDIKPQNILVTVKGQPKVTDFGIARLTGDDSGPALTRTGSTLGTWGFMAPEQRTAANQADARADIYAVGATLYALITNQTPVDLFTAELDERRVEGLPAPLEPVVRKATRYHVADRYADTVAMSDALREALTELPPDPEDAPALGFEAAPLPTAPPSSNPTLNVEDVLGGAGGQTFGLEAIDRLPESASETLAPPLDDFTGDPSDPSGTGLTLADDEPVARRGRLVMPVVAIALTLMAVGSWSATRRPAEEGTPTGPDAVAVVDPVGEDAAGEDAVGEEPVGEEPVGEDGPAEDAAGQDATGEDAVAEAPPDEDPPAAPSERPTRPVAQGSTARPPTETPTTSPDPPPPDDAEGTATEEPPEPPVEAPPAEPPPPAAPKPASVKVVSGGAERVELVGPDGARHKAGSVPAGSYRIEAMFPGTPVQPAGSVTLASGQSVTIECNELFQTCKAR